MPNFTITHIHSVHLSPTLERIFTQMADQINQNSLTLQDLLKLVQKGEADMTLAEARVATLVQTNANLQQQVKDLTAQLAAANASLDPTQTQAIADNLTLLDSHINGILPDGSINPPVITVPSTDSAASQTSAETETATSSESAPAQPAANA